MQRRDFIKGLCACCSTLGISDLLGATREIQKGDTLYSISRECEVSIAEIIKANPGIDVTKLKIGQVLTIPDQDPPPAPESPASDAAADPPPAVAPPEEPAAPPPPAPATPDFHTVTRGDTLFSISRKYNMPLADLRKLNPAVSDIITPGMTVRIRAVGPAPTVDAGPVREDVEPAKTAPPATPPAKAKAEPEKPKYVFVSGKAKAAIDRPKLGNRTWKYIVIHHSGTKTGNAKIFDYFHRRVRGMENGLAYHFVIGNGTESGDGEIETGERWTKQLQGGHVRSDAQNEIAIGICLVGDFEQTQPTRKQVSSLIELATYLRDLVGKPAPAFFLHRDINIIPTDCPGRRFPAQSLYRLFGRSPKPKP